MPFGLARWSGGASRSLITRKPDFIGPAGLFRVNGITRQAIALTLDDGPSHRTREIMDLVESHHGKSTMFLHTNHYSSIGDPTDFVAEILERGHEVGNHMPADTSSFKLASNHPDLFEEQFRKAHSALVESGVSPRWFRPAGGRYRGKVMSPLLAEYNYEPRFVLASFLPWDVWGGESPKLPYPLTYAEQLAAGLFPGAIVVFHDGSHLGDDRLERSINSLKHFLQLTADKGFVCEPLGQLVDSSANAS